MKNNSASGNIITNTPYTDMLYNDRQVQKTISNADKIEYDCVKETNIDKLEHMTSTLRVASYLGNSYVWLKPKELPIPIVGLGGRSDDINYKERALRIERTYRVPYSSLESLKRAVDGIRSKFNSSYMNELLTNVNTLMMDNNTPFSMSTNGAFMCVIKVTYFYKASNIFNNNGEPTHKAYYIEDNDLLISNSANVCLHSDSYCESMFDTNNMYKIDNENMNVLGMVIIDNTKKESNRYYTVGSCSFIINTIADRKKESGFYICNYNNTKEMNKLIETYGEFNNIIGPISLIKADEIFNLSHSEDEAIFKSINHASSSNVIKAKQHKKDLEIKELKYQQIQYKNNIEDIKFAFKAVAVILPLVTACVKMLF